MSSILIWPVPGSNSIMRKHLWEIRRLECTYSQFMKNCNRAKIVERIWEFYCLNWLWRVNENFPISSWWLGEVQEEWSCCKKYVTRGGLLVFKDSALYPVYFPYSLLWFKKWILSSLFCYTYCLSLSFCMLIMAFYHSNRKYALFHNLQEITENYFKLNLFTFMHSYY